MKKYLSIVVMLVMLTGCTSNNPEVTQLDYFYFDTSINIKIYDELKDSDVKVIDEEIDDLLYELENTYSPTIETSTINQVNNQTIQEVDTDFITILNNSLLACNETNGVYDPTSGTLIDLWSINNENYLPTQSEIEEAQKNVGCQNVEIDGNKIIMPEGYKLDFGSSVKGYAADEIEQTLKNYGVDNALINLGGNIQAVGNKYGEPFKIGIMKPEVTNELNENVAALQLANKAMVTSGINQRFFIKDDVVYHHIIDVQEGYPANNELASVSIITDSGAKADILSTMVFLMGLDDGYEYVMSLDGVEAIFITKDKKIYETTDFQLEIIDDQYMMSQL